MKKTMNQKSIRKVALHRQIVRHLQSSELEGVAGGVTTANSICLPTEPATQCHPQTPACPI